MSQLLKTLKEQIQNLYREKTKSNIFLVSKTQIKKNEMVITLGFLIAPICEAAQVFLQIFKKSNDSTSNKIPVK